MTFGLVGLICSQFYNMWPERLDSQASYSVSSQRKLVSKDWTQSAPSQENILWVCCYLTKRTKLLVNCDPIRIITVPCGRH